MDGKTCLRYEWRLKDEVKRVWAKETKGWRGKIKTC